MIGLDRPAESAAERRLIMLGSQRIEIMRQSRAGWRGAEVRIRRLIERPARGGGGGERIIGERIAKRALTRPRTGAKSTHRCAAVHLALRRLISEAELNFISAQTEAIAIAQRARRAAADRGRLAA